MGYNQISRSIVIHNLTIFINSTASIKNTNCIARKAKKNRCETTREFIQQK